MKTSRRDFIKGLGSTLAGLVLRIGSKHDPAEKPEDVLLDGDAYIGLPHREVPVTNFSAVEELEPIDLEALEKDEEEPFDLHRSQIVELSSHVSVTGTYYVASFYPISSLDSI